MKNILVRLIVLCLLLGGCSREGFLEFQPKGVVIPSTVKDFRDLLDQVDINFGSRFNSLSQGFGRQHNLNLYMSDNQYFDDDIFIALGTDQFVIRTYLFEDNVFNSQQDDDDWSLYYNQIYTANVILEGLDNIMEGSEQEIAQLRAEARLHRAYAYFNLVNIYGLHYNPASANTDLGVPIREGIILEGVDYTRASVQKTYDYLLEDITESISALEDKQPSDLTFRPSKAGAYILLAKVYLFQGKYTEALGAANLALSIKDNIRDLNGAPRSNFLSDVISSPEIKDDEQIVWFKQVRFQDIFPTDEFLNSYNNDDLRLKWFAPAEEVFGSSEIDRLYYAAAEDTSNYYMGINTTNAYLIRAECNARLGNITEANNALNQLRVNRIASDLYIPLNITDASALLQFVKEERRREMVGSVERTFDIKRYNLFDGDNISVTHTFNGQTTTLEANSPNWAFPIASKYIQQNPEIEQNPRN